MITILFKDGRRHALVTQLWFGRSGYHIYYTGVLHDNHVYTAKGKDIDKIITDEEEKGDV